MPKPPALQTLHLRNLLSFGPQGEPLELKALNVLIGPNGSGKSNLIEAVGLLRGLPRDLATTIREGGGIHHWLWKGAPTAPTATVDVACARAGEDQPPLHYGLAFTQVDQQLEVTGETLDETAGESARRHFALRERNVRLYSETKTEGVSPPLYNLAESVLSQVRSPLNYPELAEIGDLFEAIRLYRSFPVGPTAPPRRAQPSDLPNNYLEEDASNLGLVLNKLRRSGDVKRRIAEYLRRFYEDADDVDVSIEANSVQLFVHERSLSQAIPATRLSDGTLRWISLLAILLHPSPPPVVCIEEPELGLHPDIIPVLADLLRDASERMQLIVTTHSDVLVDALTDTPESVIVCEKEDGSTTLRRLDRGELAAWLEKYSLGQLWRSGQIGGNRW